MICNSNFLADILRVCVIKDLIWVMRFQSPLVYFEFRLVVQEEMSFKDTSYLELWRPFCLAEWNFLYRFVRGYHEERLRKISLKLDQWSSRRCYLNISPFYGFGSLFVQRSGTICAILLKGIIRSNSVKLL